MRDLEDTCSCHRVREGHAEIIPCWIGAHTPDHSIQNAQTLIPNFERHVLNAEKCRPNLGRTWVHQNGRTWVHQKVVACACSRLSQAPLIAYCEHFVKNTKKKPFRHCPPPSQEIGLPLLRNETEMPSLYSLHADTNPRCGNSLIYSGRDCT